MMVMFAYHHTVDDSRNADVKLNSRVDSSSLPTSECGFLVLKKFKYNFVDRAEKLVSRYATTAGVSFTSSRAFY